MRGRIFNVERYAIHDGSGIRTQTFFKGCPLSCLWCSNPEGQSFGPSLLYTPVLCIRCSHCVDTCPAGALVMTDEGLEIDRATCTGCGECAAGCYAEALEMNSVEMTAEEVVRRVERDKVFYEVSGDGGITLCGGEPLAQPEFAVELLRLCRARGIHTAVETCGCCRFSVFERAIPYLDFIYFDIKHMDSPAHRRLTGVGNELILANLRKLQACDVDICVRVPVIPGLNDGPKNIAAVAAFVKDLPRVQGVELLPYHRLGVNKYKKLGRSYPLDEISPPGEAKMRELKAIFDAYGVACAIEG